MNTITSIAYAAIYLIVLGCSNNDQYSSKSTEHGSGTDKISSIRTADSLSKLSVANDMMKNRVDTNRQCVSNLKGFYKWYSVNYDSIQVVQNPVRTSENVADNTQRFYVVEKVIVKIYRSMLRKSGFFSEKFVSRTDSVIKQKADYLSTHKQYDGEPKGFEYDQVLFTQDVDFDFSYFKYSSKKT